MFFKFKKNKYLKQISSESKIKISDYLKRNLFLLKPLYSLLMNTGYYFKILNSLFREILSNVFVTSVTTAIKTLSSHILVWMSFNL